MSLLFSPFTLPSPAGGLTLPNRIVVAPMCQYSALDGRATDWHLTHWASLLNSGAALVTLEATAVEADGRISPGCLGLLPHSPLTRWLIAKFRLELGLLIAVFIVICALGLAWQTLAGWETGGFAALNPSATMRRAIPAAALGISGMELLIASFWLTFLQFTLDRRTQ